MACEITYVKLCTIISSQVESKKLNLQAKLFLPDRVQVPIDGLSSLFAFANLDGDVWVAGARPVLGLETLCTDD